MIWDNLGIFRTNCAILTYYTRPEPSILGDPGATSRDDAIFPGESFSSWSKLSPENIASSRLVAPGSPRMRTKHMWCVLAWMLSCFVIKLWELRDSLADFSQRWQGIRCGLNRLIRAKSVYAPITFEEIVIVMINCEKRQIKLLTNVNI